MAVPFYTDRLETHAFFHSSEQEKHLANVRTLINYFQDQMKEHGLAVQSLHSPVSSEFGSPVRHPLTLQEEQSILSSYMNDHDSDGAPNRSSSSSAIAMKLPRSFAPSDLNSISTNEIVHAPCGNRVEIEYKKEISSDIIAKYGGQIKQSKSSSSFTGKKSKKNRKVNQCREFFIDAHVPFLRWTELCHLASISNDNVVQLCSHVEWQFGCTAVNAHVRI